ncbi:MAG: alanine racemase [Fibrobacterales bacterium]
MIKTPNWITINLDNLAHNYRTIKARVGKDVKVLFPVKAHGYGHGSLCCSFAAQKIGVDYLGVAHVFEGVLLRKYGITVPILALGPVKEKDFEDLALYNIIPTINSLTAAQALNDFLDSKQSPYPIHIKIDTGMHRYGIDHTATEQVKSIFKLPNLKVEGLFTHFATADEPSESHMATQLAQFDSLRAALDADGYQVDYVHAANSAAIFNYPESHYDMVRPGLALYGYNPLDTHNPENRDLGLRPILKVKARIQQISTITQGEAVSYGAKWHATHETRIAAVAIGYGDGYFRGRPNEGHLFINGKPCPILGRVCMDTTMIDISHLPHVKVGDEVSIIDHDVHQDISVESLAERFDTIPYEITCKLARRLYRHYIWKEKEWRWDDLKSELGVKK